MIEVNNHFKVENQAEMKQRINEALLRIIRQKTKRRERTSSSSAITI